MEGGVRNEVRGRLSIEKKKKKTGPPGVAHLRSKGGFGSRSCSSHRRRGDTKNSGRLESRMREGGGKGKTFDAKRGETCCSARKRGPFIDFGGRVERKVLQGVRRVSAGKKGAHR